LPIDADMIVRARPQRGACGVNGRGTRCAHASKAPAKSGRMEWSTVGYRVEWSGVEWQIGLIPVQDWG